MVFLELYTNNRNTVEPLFWDIFYSRNTQVQGIQNLVPPIVASVYSVHWRDTSIHGKGRLFLGPKSDWLQNRKKWFINKQNAYWRHFIIEVKTVTECNVLVKTLCNEPADNLINLSTHVSCKDSHSYWLVFLFFSVIWIFSVGLKFREDLYLRGFNFAIFFFTIVKNAKLKTVELELWRETKKSSSHLRSGFFLSGLLVIVL